MEIKNLKKLEERLKEREYMKTAFEYLLEDAKAKALDLDTGVCNRLLGDNRKRGGLYIGGLFQGYLNKAILANLPKLIEDALSLEEKDFEYLKEDATKEAIAVIKGDV